MTSTLFLDWKEEKKKEEEDVVRRERDGYSKRIDVRLFRFRGGGGGGKDEKVGQTSGLFLLVETVVAG